MSKIRDQIENLRPTTPTKSGDAVNADEAVSKGQLTSTTPMSGLNADMVDGKQSDVSSVVDTIPVRDVDSAIAGKNQCTAWVNFNGTNGTIRDSYNVSSVVRDANGKYTISFSTSMANANYAIAGIAGEFQGAGRASNRVLSNKNGNMDVNGFNIQIHQLSNDALNDIEQVFLQVFGGK